MPSSSSQYPVLVGGLLDAGRIDGQLEVTSWLRPERTARPVATGDLERMRDEIARACQVWGGGSQPIVPFGSAGIPPAYARLLGTEQVDYLGGLDGADTEVEAPARVSKSYPQDHPALLIAATKSKDDWLPVEVVDLSPDDPWRDIYATTLGWWPSEPDPGLLDFAMLREDLAFDEVVNVARTSVEGSLDDLARRIKDSQHQSPRSFSNTSLAFGLRPDSSFLHDEEPILPNPRRIRRAAGPNVVVGVSPGSVEDLALVWNLRGAHGMGRALPIGVPIELLDADTLKHLQGPELATAFGMAGGRCFLTSTSASTEELLARVGDSDTRVVAWEEVLTFGPAPGRPRSHLCSWKLGRTRIHPKSDADREVLRHSHEGRGVSLVLDLAVNAHSLPADPTMRGRRWSGRFQAGMAQVEVSELRRENTTGVTWPSGWTSLAAVCRTRGLIIQESEPGLAAATLIRSIGSIDEIRMLQHGGLLKLLWRMAERSGMSWWKRRWTEANARLLESGADPTALDEAAVLLGRDDPAVAPAGEGRAVDFQQFVRVLGQENAARHWVGWAERRHLLVRGAEILCTDCRTESWLPLGALPPPIPCPGCGRQIEHPYEPRALKFSYRLGEAMRRVLETDSIGHVLALHWFVRLFDRGGLVGAHPGVVFSDVATPETPVGEADVVLLFADGEVVPAEVKRRGGGVDERALELLDRLSDVLLAPWDAVVVTEPARDAQLVRGAERTLPERPRVLITDDQLHEELIIWSMGANPFAWNPRTAEEDAKRSTEFAMRRSEHDPDAPWDFVSEELLRDRSETSD